MSEENQEYEVESVVAAKVEKEEPSGKRKKPKLVWSYRVRWKGYTPDEDTWEPAESFADSEQILDAFWSRVSTNGRDKNDLRLFKYGEEIFPSGPPARKKSTTNLSKPGPSQPNKTPSESSQPAKLSKRHRSPDIEIVESPPPSKKAREASIEIISPPPTQTKGKAPATPAATSSFASPSRTRSQRRKVEPRPISPEVVPPSDGEMDEDILTNKFTVPSKRSAFVIDITASSDGASNGTSSKEPRRNELPQLSAKPESRATRSRIQTIDAPGLAVPDGALSAKSKAMRSAQHPNESNKPPKRMKAGPGRSSSGFIANNTSTLLTSDKGTLKSVRPRRRRAKTPENIETPEPEVTIVDTPQEIIPPSGDELLQASGLRKEDADALDDFDEDMEDVAAVAAAVDPTAEPKTPDIPTTPLTTRLQRVTEQLFPSRGSEPDVDAKLLKTSTIFGPLGLGVSATQVSQPALHHVSLNLDSSLSIPVIILPASNEVFSNFETTSGTAPPGKFYDPNAGNGLLASVRASGASALVELASDASDEEKTHFTFFSARLHKGDLFVAFTGVQSWVFCSPSNTMAAQRLNIPSHLLNESQKVLVSKIEIVNYTGYADAAADADSRRWAQYLTSISER